MSVKPVFEYVKIDSTRKNEESQTYSAEPNNEERNSAFLSNEIKYEAGPSLSVGKSDTKTIEKKLNGKFGSDDNYIEITGRIGFTVTASIKLYRTFTQAYMELKFDYSADVGINVTGQLSHTFSMDVIGLSPVPGVYIELTPIIYSKADYKF